MELAGSNDVSRERVVRAAGGVVVDDGRVAVVHRPGLDDWSLPKGHLESGESDAEAAVREVWEETGLRCRIVGDESEPAATTEYRDGKDRPKRVVYFVMTVEGGSFTVNDEVDELRWVGPDDLDLLSYPGDREIAAAVLDRNG